MASSPWQDERLAARASALHRRTAVGEKTRAVSFEALRRKCFDRVKRKRGAILAALRGRCASPAAAPPHTSYTGASAASAAAASSSPFSSSSTTSSATAFSSSTTTTEAVTVSRPPDPKFVAEHLRQLVREELEHARSGFGAAAPGSRVGSRVGSSYTGAEGVTSPSSTSDRQNRDRCRRRHHHYYDGDADDGDGMLEGGDDEDMGVETSETGDPGVAGAAAPGRFMEVDSGGGHGAYGDEYDGRQDLHDEYAETAREAAHELGDIECDDVAAWLLQIEEEIMQAMEAEEAQILASYHEDADEIQAGQALESEDLFERHLRQMGGDESQVVLCPVCRERYLLSNRSVIFCECGGMRVDSQGDAVTLPHLKEALRMVHESHLQQRTGGAAGDGGGGDGGGVCHGTLRFSCVSVFGSAAHLQAECQECRFLQIVI